MRQSKKLSQKPDDHIQTVQRYKLSTTQIKHFINWTTLGL